MTNKLTPEEKDFNRAMCTTCLLDWPMAQCLSCKFYAPCPEVDFDHNRMEMNMDYRTATKVLSAVEQATLEQMVKENPGNTYWEKRLEDFIDNMNPSDIAQLAEREIDAMLDNRPTYTESELTRKTKAEATNRKPWPKYGYTGADSKGTVDVSNIPAYSTHKPMVHKGGSYDNHESHAWTVDGE